MRAKGHAWHHNMMSFTFTHQHISRCRCRWYQTQQTAVNEKMLFGSNCSPIYVWIKKNNTHEWQPINTLKTSLTYRSCIWCRSPAGTSPRPLWTPGTVGRVLYPTAASPESRRLLHLVLRLRLRPRRSSCSSSRTRGWEPPPPIAETAAYDWFSDSSCFTQRHLILSGLRGAQILQVLK